MSTAAMWQANSSSNAMPRRCAMTPWRGGNTIAMASTPKARAAASPGRLRHADGAANEHFPAGSGADDAKDQ